MTSRLLALAVVTAGFLAVPAAAHGVDIATPPNQSGVTEGETVTVSGGDCPGGQPVRVFFTAEGQQAVSTTPSADGSWSVALPVPSLAVSNVLEASEQSIVAECAGERTSVVVVYTRASGGEEELPFTGPSITAALAGLGTVLIVLGVCLVCGGRRRGLHEMCVTHAGK